MNVRFLLGPAGSGKTFRCLEEIRARLTADPLGPPLILLAPRQATYQLELQLLSGSGLAGYTRLQIVPFERFAAWLLEQLESPPRALLSEEGRVMVLRALLHQHHGDLTVFGTSSRAAGFARLLSRQLHELQQHRTTPEALRRAAEQIGGAGPLRDKLHDLAFLLERYRDWLARQNSPDAGTLIEQAIERLEDEARRDRSTLRLDGLWLDGAAELTPQELDLLAAIVPFCDEATLAFCLESEPVEDPSWLSTWAVIAQTYRRSRARLAAVEGCKISVEILGRGPHTTRFSCGRLPGVAAGAPRGRQGELFAGPEESLKAATEAASSLIGLLEANWTRPAATAVAVAGSGIALVRCDEPEQEAVAAAREILRFVHAGHRFRECAVLVRNLDTHHAGLRRVFTRYGIPFFLDRRESVAHHPLAQLTRGALHTVQFHWRLTDWFSALKSGLTSLTENEVDLLENAAIANGWEGGAWSRPLELADNPGLGRDCERCRERVMPAFLKLRDAIAGTPTGGQLAAAIRRLWEDLGVPDRMQEWTTAADARGEASGSAHQTVLEELTGWLEDLELAFREVALPLRDWLPILEAGLGSLTVGVIPPAVDQVLIGAVDRSRNPDLKLALVLGLNEGVFPRPVDDVSLFTEGERTTLEATPLRLPGDRRLRLGHERYLGYIACTRARERLVLTWSENDAGGNPLNPSAFVDQVRRMFPFLTGTRMEPAIGLSECVHPVEVLTPLLRADLRTRTEIHRLRGELLEVDDWLRRFDGYRGMLRQERLGADAILKLFGTRLRTSASRLEEYAACPFKFFVTAGLRARERDRFEVDARKTGTFMHEVLRQFHVELARERKLWRSLALDEARERIARIAGEQQGLVAGGVLAAHPRSRFAAAAQTRLLQDFVVATIEWMTAYRFDPIAVELSLGGEDADLPWWEIDLGDDRKLAFRGSVDRVDAAPVPGREGEVCLNVLDYKSGQKKFDELKMQAGLQLQLPAYLAALCAVADRSDLLGGRRAVPTGMFYVRLKGPSSGAQERDEPDSEVRGFEHTGRFSFEFLPLFDARAGEGGSGQFNYRLKKDGQPHGNSRELVPQTRVERMIEEAGVMLRHMGREILGGRIAVDPYRKGSELPCTWCSYGSICRIDRWTHAYRPLRPLLTEADAG